MGTENLETKKIRSFDRSFKTEIYFKTPDKYKDLENFTERNYIAIGSNFSYPAIGFSNNSVSVEMHKFNRIIDFNKEKKEITVEGGIKIFELLNFTLRHDLWLPQLPGYPYISLGGALATNAHGKSCGIHGTIRNNVKEILLFHSKNGWIKISEKENKEIFDLTLGGLGLTGIIVNVTLKLNDFKFDAFNTNVKQVSSTEDTIKILNEKDKEDKYLYSWNRADSLKNFGRGFVFENKLNKKIGNGKAFSIKPYKKNFWSKFFIFNFWNSLSLKTANSFFENYYMRKTNFLEDNLTKAIFPFVGKEIYFNLFGNQGFLESQLLIDRLIFSEFVEEYKFLFKKYNPIITLLSLKNMSGKQKYLRFEDNKICLTFDFVNNKINKIFMSKIDELCIKFKILPSIIKDSRINESTFNQCYTDASLFKTKLKQFDKNRVYKSELSERLGL